MASANDFATRLVILRGDDTGGTFGRALVFTIETDGAASLDGCRAEWEFDGIVKRIDAPLVEGEAREIFYSHNETRCMRLGVRFGSFRIIDAAGKVRTFDNTKPVEVTDNVSRVYPGSSAATVTIGAGVTWDGIAGKPKLVKTINGEDPDAQGNINVASGGTVKSATVNGGEKVVPDARGNLALTVKSAPSDYDAVRQNAATGAAHASERGNPHGTTAAEIEDFADGVRDTMSAEGISSSGINIGGEISGQTVSDQSGNLRDAINEMTAHYLTADAQGNAFATAAALKAATSFYYAGDLHTPDKNDYCIVRADEDHKTAAGLSPTTRYLYVGETAGEGEWVYAYTVNETSLTQAQLNALNSGITSEKVEKIDELAKTRCTIGVAGDGLWRISSVLVDTTKNEIKY